MSFSWTVTPEQAWGQLAEVTIKAIEADIVELCESLLDPIEQWMRANHGWTNRSGDAEEGLYSDLIHVAGQTVGILVSHGPAIEYAEYLETIRQGELGVITQAVDQFGPVVFRGVRAILRKHTG